MVASRVGVIGVGVIGSVVTQGLLASGYRTEIYDIDEAAVAVHVAHGARAAVSIADMGRVCEVVMICVVSEPQLRSVAGELLSAGWPVVVVHSTVGPQAVAELAGRVPEAIIIDAPVSDSRRAAQHRLFSFVGAPGRLLPPSAESALRSYCHGLEVVGEVGAGQVMKLVCNTISLVTASAVAEALNMCASYGVDREVAARVAANGSADSWVLANWNRLAPRAPIVRKDLSAATELGRRAGVDMPVTAAARDASEATFG
jgi:3-hydroxyisobutyrate dehydrogenase